MRFFLAMTAICCGGSVLALSIPVENLRPNASLTNVEIRDGEFHADVSGGDPYINTRDFPAFKAAENQILRFDLLAGEGNSPECQLFWITDEDPKFDEAKSLRLTIPKFGEWVTLQADLYGKPTWKGNIVGFRFDPVANNSHKNIALRNIEFSPLPVLELPMTGWTVNDHIKSRETGDGVLSATLTPGKNDPNLNGPALSPLPAEKFRYVKFDLAVPAGAGENAQLFFQTKEMKGFAGNAVANFKVIPDGEFHSYVINLSDNAAWKGQIIRIRIDPTNRVPQEGTVRLRNARIDSSN